MHSLNVTLTRNQIADFVNLGFLAIDRITADDEIEQLREIFDRLFDARTGESRGLFYDLAAPRGHAGRNLLPQVLGPDLHVPELRESTYYRNARALGATLLGVPEDELKIGGHMIMKPARYGAETPWHQDEAYWDPNVVMNSLSVWLSLDEATVESGCMQFIPGSHQSEDVHEHRHIDDDPLIHGLVTDHVDPTHAVSCPLSPGGATFHHSRTLHHTGANRTPAVRRAYILVCSGPADERDTPAHRPWQQDERNALARAGIDVQVF